MSRALGARLEKTDWADVAARLDEAGWATIGPLLSARECDALIESYDDDALFRKEVDMAKHGFGSGVYRYFTYPLPSIVAKLRTALYPQLANIANCWESALGRTPRFPAAHGDWLAACAAAGQTRPTPLLFRYDAGDYNRLHQDLYGDRVFPLQVTVLLSRPGTDFDGGEFVLTEQRPRMQSRATVVPLEQAGAVVFPVRERPARGVRGVHRVAVRHGVSPIRSGRRHTLGLIFHDAR